MAKGSSAERLSLLGGLGGAAAAVAAIQARLSATIKAASSMSVCGLHRRRAEGTREGELPSRACFEVPHATRSPPRHPCRRPLVDHHDATLVRANLAGRDDRVRHANDHGYPK